jgi:hypothetical protein
MKVGGLTEYTGQIYALIDGSSITLFDGMYVQAFVNKSSRSEHCWLFAFAFCASRRAVSNPSPQYRYVASK